VHESDICIIGGGITSAMLALKLSQLRPTVSLTVVEAGRSIFDVQNRGRYRERALQYHQHPWPGDFIEDQQARGNILVTMAVGGHHLEDDGSGGPGAALGRRLQPVQRGGPASAVALRPRRRLADRVGRAREVLL